jgi:hypothetical protein
MTSPFMEILTRYRSIELAYNTCPIEEASAFRQAHTDVMDELIAKQLVATSPAEMLEALRQAKTEMNAGGDDWTQSLDGYFVHAALSFVEKSQDGCSS